MVHQPGLAAERNCHQGPRHVPDIDKIAADLEIAGQERKIEAFIELMRPFGIIELTRTGRIAMVRGAATTPAAGNRLAE